MLDGCGDKIIGSMKEEVVNVSKDKRFVGCEELRQVSYSMNLLNGRERLRNQVAHFLFS